MTAKIHHIHRKPSGGKDEHPVSDPAFLDISVWAVSPDYAQRRRAEAARIASVIAETRKYRWQQRVKWGAIILAYAVVVYFCFQMGRGR